MALSYKGSLATDMISPHGSLLVNRIIENEHDINEIVSREIVNVEITEDVLLEIENIANGIYSPLTGFPPLKDIDSILSDWTLTNGTVFPIPPLCHINDNDFKRVKENEEIILLYESVPRAVMHVLEKSNIDKNNYIETIFKTKDTSHPGVSYVQEINDNIITGTIEKFGSTNYYYNKDVLTPFQTRREIEKRGWNTITAFSTSNIPHCAHEYLIRIALEISDGVFIHALSQIDKPPKFTKRQIRDCYLTLIDNFYHEGNIILSFLPTVPRSAGSRSSLMQAIIRQNYGCTHQVFGRDHEGFKDIYQKYESQQILDKFHGIDIKPIKLREPYYCKKCQCIVTERTCRHENVGIEISGTNLREMLDHRREIPEYYIRQEVLDCLNR